MSMPIVEKVLDHQCKKCQLCKSSKHVCIGGKGDPLTTSIMLIGEAPGRAEENTGQPFMGRAGKLLDQLISNVGLYEHCYISNAVHCRPPENRKPTEGEIIACRQYLVAEIKLVKPRIIVLMGKTAIEALELITSRRMGRAGEPPFMIQRIFGMNNVWFIPTWHPAYCLRRGEGATNDLRRALSRAQALLIGIKSSL